MTDFEYWYPWSPARYRADTLHLSCEEDGIYRRLIDHYMETRLPLPDNNLALARIAGTDSESIEKAMEKLRLLFRLSEGKLHLKKCDEILADQDARSKKYSENGKKGGRPKSIVKTQEKTNSKAESKLQQSTVQYSTVQESKKESSAVAHATLSDFQKIFDAGCAVNPALMIKSTAVIHQWLADGVTPEDAVPEVERLAANARSWSFFTGAVLDAKSTRLKPLPQGNPHGTTSNGAIPNARPNKSERAKAAILESAIELGYADRPPGWTPGA